MTAAALLALGLVAARDAACGVLTGSWSDRAGPCALLLEQYDGSILHLRTRAAGPEPTETCVPAFADLAAGLGRLLSTAAPAGVTTLYLGSVGEVPGLPAELVAAARSSSDWDQEQGRPRSGDPNGFVAGVLRGSAVLRELLPGYEIVGVTVEKVLVPTRRAIRERHADDGIPDARLPYDAQLWVRLRRGTGGQLPSNGVPAPRGAQRGPARPPSGGDAR